MPFDPSNIDAEDFLEALGIENRSEATSDEINFSCPFPGHVNADENASAYMNVETTAFFCHGCKARGTAVDFAATLLEISPLKAIKLLKERYQPGYINPDVRSTEDEVRKVIAGPKKKEKRQQPTLPETALQEFSVDWYAVEKAITNHDDVHPALMYPFYRGFTADTLTDWEFGFDKFSDRITFAVRNEKNEIVGFKGRSYNKRQPKYLIIGDRPGKPERYGWPCYLTGQIVFGIRKAVQTVDPNNEDCARNLIICEGELNAIALWQAGYPGVAINGSNFTEDQARIIKHDADAVTVFFDSDQAGHDGIWGNSNHSGVVDLLNPYIPVRIVPDHEGDPADMEASEIQEIIEEAQVAAVLGI